MSDLVKIFEDFKLNSDSVNTVYGGLRGGSAATGDTVSGNPEISDDCDLDPSPIIVLR